MPVSGGISQVTVWLPIKNETRLLNYRLALLVCRSPLSLSLNLFITPTHTFDLPLYLSFHLTYSYSPYPSIFPLVDCNKTLALQFMFAPLAPSPAQPQLLPVVHGSGSLPSAKGIYS